MADAEETIAGIVRASMRPPHCAGEIVPSWLPREGLI